MKKSRLPGALCVDIFSVFVLPTRIALIGVLPVCLVATMSSAQASLIGDTVYSYHEFPTQFSDHSGNDSAVVTADSSDIMDPHGYGSYTIDVNSDTITIIHNQLYWNISEDFNGMFIDSLNDSSGNPLSSVSVITDISNWSDSLLSFDEDSIWINLIYPNDQQLGVGNITLSLDFASVPIPAAAWLFGSGLLGLVGMARRKKA